METACALTWRRRKSQSSGPPKARRVGVIVRLFAFVLCVVFCCCVVVALVLSSLHEDTKWFLGLRIAYAKSIYVLHAWGAHKRTPDLDLDLWRCRRCHAGFWSRCFIFSYVSSEVPNLRIVVFEKASVQRTGEPKRIVL